MDKMDMIITPQKRSCHIPKRASNNFSSSHRMLWDIMCTNDHL